MSVEKIVPKDPLLVIKNCVIERKIVWTYHVNMRMGLRAITRDIVVQTVDSYEIIESYPADKYLPSYLVYAIVNSKVIHILFAVDVTNNQVRVVTAYYPKPELWSKDLKRRKQ